MRPWPFDPVACLPGDVCIALGSYMDVRTIIQSAAKNDPPSADDKAMVCVCLFKGVVCVSVQEVCVCVQWV